MADIFLEGAGFWLPAEFFADEDIDILKDQENASKPEPGSDFCFPTEFPYDFQTGNQENLEKAAWVMSTSPQSTLGNLSGGSAGGSIIGRPNNVPRPLPQLAVKNDNVVDLICHAAGQVAKLKLNSGDGLRPASPPRFPAQIYPSTRTTSPSIFQRTRAPVTVKQQNSGCGMWYGVQQQIYDYRSGKTVVKMEQDARVLKKNPTRNIGSCNREFSFGGSGGGRSVTKRSCAGTGVFLPRAHGSLNEISCNAYSSESHRKPVYPTSLLQERNVDPLFKYFENMKTALVQSPSQPQPETRFNGGFVSDYDLLMVRRNSIMLQYQKNLLSEKWAMGREYIVPQAWN